MKKVFTFKTKHIVTKEFLNL